MDKVMDSSKERIEEKLICAVFLIFIIGNLLHGFVGVTTKGVWNPDDFTMRYRESKYVLSGINPFEVMKGRVEPLTNIGILWENGGTAPWALGIGIITNFTFLPEYYARICALGLYILILVATCWSVKNYCKQHDWASSKIFIVILGICALPGWGTGLAWLNYGCLFGGILIIGVLNKKKYPYLFYISIGLSSLKPQLALPFYFALLYKKEWKGILIASILPISGWILVSLLTRTPPTDFLIAMSEIGSTYDSQSIVKLIQFIFSANFPQKVADCLSAIICVCGICYFWKQLKQKSIMDDLLFYSIPAVFGGMWMYTQEHDRTILGLFIIVLIPAIFCQGLKIYHKFFLCTLLFTLVYPDFFKALYCMLINTQGIYIIYLFALLRYFFQIFSLIIIFEYLPNTLLRMNRKDKAMCK
ncbi:uncharacterized protein DUF2029 [Hungatella effluvii]|uniref:Uncharacterized protein DUF2029 n=1 Tax=Hungatella effluvii TaxID=1096246 RepID=A0A2V3XZZ2_9FIRM|nr:glycosyltransferase 87 family protein [Hungatella effluvii]PXX48947.1 uncharacterized protein DUF2029 [Hungatella effluvii]